MRRASFGNGLMLPAGPLREPVSRLRDVDAVVRLVARDAPHPPAPDGRRTLMTHEPLPWRNLRHPEREADPAQWAGREVHAVAGIGNPQRFFAMVRGAGHQRRRAMRFPTTTRSRPATSPSPPPPPS